MSDLFEELAKPFPETKIHWRIGATNARSNGGNATKGVPLAYVDARDVMERLDFVMGPQNWQCRYPFTGCCELGLRINGEWVWKSNGAGETKMEAEKGQYSDAFKRAAVMFGVGRYLYGLPNEWVDLDGRGKPKQPPKLPPWATPNGWKRISPKVKKEVYDNITQALADNDDHGVLEAWDEFDNDEKTQLWSMFNAYQRKAIEDSLNIARGKAA